MRAKRHRPPRSASPQRPAPARPSTRTPTRPRPPLPPPPHRHYDGPQPRLAPALSRGGNRRTRARARVRRGSTR
ncbi:hypothetical protein DSY14_27880 [Nocardiopsis sp. MG754419]|nr:hypothetical protein [Nocardiopsis sp. MG754419]